MDSISLLLKPASGRCNMRCAYCFYVDEMRHRHTPDYGIMRPDTLEQAVKGALNSARKTCTFAFQGGEPTLAGLDFFRLAIDLQKKYNTNGIQIYNAIQTNGYALDDTWIEFFAHNRFLVGVSLDGTREIHNGLRRDSAGGDTYAAVKKSIAMMERYGVEYNILCVVSGPVARHPQKVYRALRDYRHLQFIPCLEGFDREPKPYLLTSERYAGFLKTTFDLYYQDLCHRVPVSIRDFDNYIMMLAGRPPELCGMGGLCTCQLVVEADGSVYPCDFYVLDEYRLGNIRDASIEQLLGCGAARRFVEASYPVPAPCRACEWFALCRNGCRRNRMDSGDEALGPNRFCEAYQEFFRHAYPRMAQLGRQLCATHIYR